ncbi:MAG: hypothetical protein JWM42_443 [Burkholderia sp.]|jgi:hypothetical protein|nr:hypothetical protein [Burkholderia sp.]
MKIVKSIGTTIAVAVVGLSGSYVSAQEFSTRLSGFNEVPAAIFTSGTGKLRLKLDRRDERIDYTLSYSGLTTAVTQAHIHFGKKHVAGGIIAFFCSNLGNGPAGTPVCPSGDGTVSGTITANEVVGQATQNVTAGDFAALVAALTSETGYANVHTSKFAAGEIRGEIRGEDRHRSDDHHGDKHD